MIWLFSAVLIFALIVLTTIFVPRLPDPFFRDYDCADSCGNVSFRFPDSYSPHFGPYCVSGQSSFKIDIVCDNSSNPPTPLFSRLKLEVTKIDYPKTPGDYISVTLRVPWDQFFVHRRKKLAIVWDCLRPFLIFIAQGILLFLLGCYWLIRVMKRRKGIKMKARLFKRNGGLLLQQQMTSNKGVVDKTKIFTVFELEKATDDFNENRILGKGGQGIVYKGMLMDGRIVAIKRSKQVDEGQLEQFINEVIILSQINHRNVVKLLGCCLETEVPLLVYEYIPNGTLAKHIYNSNEEFQLTWKMRLQIAADTAGALSYLHSSSSSPIYHRDIKSSNILLDDKYRGKVSDFGTSRTITIDQTHLTTIIKGTFGYFDPEYFQTNQFTEKSDVYSFGVVLVELLTSKKPIYEIQPNEWRNLATEFLSMMETSHDLLDIVDRGVLREGKEEELWAVANLAKECLNSDGKLRPTMKQVATLLEQIVSAHVPATTTTTAAQQNFPSSDSLAADVQEFVSAPLCVSADSSEEPISCSIEIPMSNTI